MLIRKVIPALVVGALLGFGVPSADAATTVGQAAPNTGSVQLCSGGNLLVQDVDTGNPAYVFPASGVITSWSSMGGPADHDMQLKVVRESPADNYTITGSSKHENVAAGILNTFASRIPVSAGNLLSMWLAPSAGSPCLYTAPPGNTVRLTAVGPEPALGSTAAATSLVVTTRLDISAQVEPDADADGFGDETQDICPSLATNQGDCADPETTIDSRKVKTKGRKGTATIAFSSSEANAIANCSFDSTAWRPCKSPVKQKLSIGKHTFAVTTIDQAGNADPTPATAKINVKRGK